MTDQRTRDLGMALMAIFFFFVMAGVAVWVLFFVGGWWRLALIPIVILMCALLYGIGDSLQLKDRSKDTKRSTP